MIYPSIDKLLNLIDSKYELVHIAARRSKQISRDGYLQNEQDINVAALSASGKDKLRVWTDKGYEVTSAKVSYTLAWKPQDSKIEYAVCLANIQLAKQEITSE